MILRGNEGENRRAIGDRGEYLAKILAKTCWHFLWFFGPNESGNQIYGTLWKESGNQIFGSFNFGLFFSIWNTWKLFMQKCNYVWHYMYKHRKNRKTLPREHSIGCLGVKMFLLKDPFFSFHNFRFVMFQVLSRFEFFLVLS